MKLSKIRSRMHFGRAGEQALTLLLCVAIVASELSGIAFIIKPSLVRAAQVTVDSSAEATGDSHTQQGRQTVFTSDTTGYKFYRDSGGDCVYSKTTDKGVNWDSAVQIDSQADCIAVAVWYDQWTPNATSGQPYIHIVTMDTSADDVFYNRLDPTTDTRLMAASPVSASGAAQAGRFDLAVNYPAITKATDGTVYIAVNDATTGGGDHFVIRCSTSCGTGSNWTEAGTSPLDSVDGDFNLLAPLTNGHVLLINRDVSADDLRSKIWNGTAWSAAWTTIDSNAPENTTYDVGMAFTLASSTVAATTTTFLAYAADNDTLGTNDDIRIARYQNGVWASSTTSGAGLKEVTTNDTKGITNVAIARDTTTGNLYVAYNARTTAGTPNTANTYWKMSTTSMQSWSTEAEPINSSADDLYGIDLNISNNQRIYATWFDNTDDDIYGDTLVDLVPGVTASTTGSQIAQATASTSNVYIGGAFVFTETVSSRNVSGITITENGSINAQTALNNIKLYYENDPTYPYDCATNTYDGGGAETQFGSTDTNGFSGTDGVSAFTGSLAPVSTTSALCVYVVMDVLDSAENNSTINVTINSPTADFTVTGGGDIGPVSAVDITGSTTVKNDVLTQTHFHFRNDTGSESAATSRTGGTEDTALTAIQQSSPLRIRMQVSNEGGTTSAPTQYRLEYGVATSTCSSIVTWVDVGATADQWDMYNSPNLTDGADTTNITIAGNGAVTDENISFVSPNGAVKDTSSQTAAITATSTQFVEFEYSVIASTTATEGNTYCFRLTNAGTPLPSYLQYPRATIAADVAVSAVSSQVTQTDVPSTSFYIGGAYAIVENASSRSVDSITLTENGTVDGATGLDNIRLRYEYDISVPYDCATDTYNGTETQYGVTDTDGFSSANGTSTFTGTSTITTTQAMCVYVIVDVTTSARNDETIDIVINQPSSEVTVSGGGSVSPSATRDITGSTTLRGPVLTQAHYHWRRDNGTEVTASSSVGGVQDTALSRLDDDVPARLRIEVSNEGATTSSAVQYRLEYGAKVTTCSAVTQWTDVGDVGGAWDMYDSPNLTNGANTTNIASAAFGAVTDENISFITANGGVRDTTSQTGNITATSTQFVELEYSIEQTGSAGFSVSYCFRLSNAGTALDAYSVYPELTTAPKRDFKVQRGTVTMTGTTFTITGGGVDYESPSASTSAFIRITNAYHTGAGANTGGGNPGAADMTTYITNPSNLLTSVTFARAGGTRNTRVSWEIVEYVGDLGGDNEMIVRKQEAVTYGTTDTFATGSAATGIVNDADVAVFITGQLNPDGGTANFNTGQSVSSWTSTTDQPIFERGEHGNDASIVSYAVVEFTGPNWLIQRASHTYTAAGSAETEDITAVNSLERTFLHTQKLSGAGLNGNDEYGAEAWLSSVGQVSFRLQSGATTPSGQRSVVWILENTQTSNGAMVVTRSSGQSSGGTSPLTVSIEIGATLDDLTNSSIFVNNRTAGTGANYPQPLLGATIASTTHYEFWRSDTGAATDYRTEIVEWPVAGLSFRQNYYRVYVDNNELDPTDPWPAGPSDLGENTSVTAADVPPGDGERLRLRISIEVSNATLPTSTQAFKLEFGQRVTTCSAISSSDWRELGDSASSTVWRGYNATGTTDGTVLSGNPPTAGDLNLSVSDVAGTLEEENTSVSNSYSAEDGQDVEYDWFVQMNGATADTFYCFRMVRADDTSLDGYNNYPQIRTASFSPKSQNWRWYDDEGSVTPTVDLADEDVAPIDIENQNPLKLRVTVKETKVISQNDTRFKLQFSEYGDFSTSTYDVVATSSCFATSTWCYANGGGTDNTVVTTKVLSDADSCSGGVGNGCGTHNEDPDYKTGFRHEGGAATEYEFTIVPAGPRVNRVYYFRLYDLVQDLPVAYNTGETYPSLMTEGASLTSTATGLATTTATEGIVTDVASTPNSVAFGHLVTDTPLEAAQRLTVTTNATEGYQTLIYAPSSFISSHGEIIPPVNASNTAPAAWNSVCSGTAWGCFGYHSGDDILQSGSARFAPNDTFAALETVAREVAYSSIPVTNDTVDVVYKVVAQQDQPAGQYELEVVFITSPSF